jgi:hypothetical protein
MAVVNLDRVGLDQGLAFVEEIDVRIADAEVPVDRVAELVDGSRVKVPT